MTGWVAVLAMAEMTSFLELRWWLLSCIILLLFDLTCASPIDDQSRKQRDESALQTSSSSYGKDSKTKNTGLLSRSLSSDQKEVATIVGGSVSVGIVFILSVFLVFWIYKKRRIRKDQQRRMYPNSRQVRQEAQIRRDRRNASTSIISPLARQPVNYQYNTSTPFATLQQQQQQQQQQQNRSPAGDPMEEVSIPNKAATVFGLGRGEGAYQPSSLPQAPSLLVPANGDDFIVNEFRPPGFPAKNARWSMSTLGRELYEDTKHEPRPEKFINATGSEARTSQRPANPGRGTTRYFVPLFSEDGGLAPNSGPESFRSVRGFR